MNGAGIPVWLVISFAGGVALGGVFFGGLWLTVRSLPNTVVSRDNATPSAGGSLLVVLSFIVRTALVLVGMYWLTAGDWRSVLACLAGFLVARTVIIKQVFRSLPTGSQPQKVSENSSRATASDGPFDVASLTGTACPAEAVPNAITTSVLGRSCSGTPPIVQDSSYFKTCSRKPSDNDHVAG